MTDGFGRGKPRIGREGVPDVIARPMLAGIFVDGGIDSLRHGG